MIFLNGNKIGEVIEETYKTYRNPKIHFYRKGLGYPISTEVLEFLKMINVRKILIIEEGRYIKKYWCHIFDYDDENPFKEKGYDEQKCFPLKNMEEII